MYDQGLVVYLPQDKRFYANFRFELKKEFSSDIKYLKAIKEDSYGAFNSKCWKTMIGTVQDLTQISEAKVQCFYGKKVDGLRIEESTEQIY